MVVTPSLSLSFPKCSRFGVFSYREALSLSFPKCSRFGVFSYREALSLSFPKCSRFGMLSYREALSLSFPKCSRFGMLSYREALSLSLSKGRCLRNISGGMIGIFRPTSWLLPQAAARNFPALECLTALNLK